MAQKIYIPQLNSPNWSAACHPSPHEEFSVFASPNDVKQSAKPKFYVFFLKKILFVFNCCMMILGQKFSLMPVMIICDFLY